MSFCVYLSHAHTNLHHYHYYYHYYHNYCRYVQHHASALRALNYPHLEGEHAPVAGQLRASAHTDYGTCMYTPHSLSLSHTHKHNALTLSRPYYYYYHYYRHYDYPTYGRTGSAGMCMYMCTE